MNRFIVLFCLVPVLLGAAPLRTIPNATWVEDESNRADRFMVSMDGRILRVRLFFVEAPPVSILAGEDETAMLVQSRYYGIPDITTMPTAGRQALSFTRNQLATPFTVYLPQDAEMTGTEPVLAFVKPAGGGDLAAMLVRQGLARPRGPVRNTPLDVSADEMHTVLLDLEDTAMLERRGIWAFTDPAILARSRAEQRRNVEPSRQSIPRPAAPPRVEASLRVNINQADAQQLMQLPGMTPSMAERIIRGRPYRNAGDLLDVRGVGETLLRSWEQHLVATGP